MADLAAQIACVKREIALRERVYPKWGAAGRMKKEAAEREIAAMKAVLATLEGIGGPTLPRDADDEVCPACGWHAEHDPTDWLRRRHAGATNA